MAKSTYLKVEKGDPTVWAINVFLGDAARQVGILRFDIQGARQRAGFEYHSTWLEADDAFAIDPQLPLVGDMGRTITRRSISNPTGEGDDIVGVLASRMERARCARGRPGHISGSSLATPPVCT